MFFLWSLDVPLKGYKYLSLDSSSFQFPLQTEVDLCGGVPQRVPWYPSLTIVTWVSKQRALGKSAFHGSTAALCMANEVLLHQDSDLSSQTEWDVACHGQLALLCPVHVLGPQEVRHKPKR